jgi:hypothetical protein
MEFGDYQTDAICSDDALDLPFADIFEFPSSLGSPPPQLPQAPPPKTEVLANEKPVGTLQSDRVLSAHAQKTGGKRKRQSTDEIEVIDSGFIMRAPVPVGQAEALENAAGVEEGTYFVELMRKRLRCIHDIQVRWVTRTCNKKKPKYVETQTRLKDFAEVVLNAFEAQFGPTPKTMTVAPTRKHSKPRTSAPPPIL